MGAGRIVYQDLTKITKAINDGDFFENPALIKAMDSAKKNSKKLHRRLYKRLASRNEKNRYR